MPSIPFKPPSLHLLRSFATTTAPHNQKVVSEPYKSVAQLASRRLPPYPYHSPETYKQSSSGLYGTSHIQFGNIISSKNAIKTRRSWHPNIHSKRLWSDALQKFIKVKVQARVLRTIDKVGGLDAYLLGDTPGRIRELGEEGWRLRWRVWKTGSVKRQRGEERVKLGLHDIEPIENTNATSSDVLGLDPRLMEDEKTLYESRQGLLGDDITLLPFIPPKPAGTRKSISRSEGKSSLVGIRSADPQSIETEEQQDSQQHQEDSSQGKDEYIQADDSKSMFSKLRGMFKK